MTPYQIRDSDTDELLAEFLTLDEAIRYADEQDLVGIYIALDKHLAN